MSHEQRPGMFKIPSKKISKDDICKISTTANCSIKDVKAVINVLKKHRGKKEYLDLAQITSNSGLKASLVKTIMLSIDAVTHGVHPVVKEIKPTFLFSQTKGGDDTENPGPLIDNNPPGKKR